MQGRHVFDGGKRWKDVCCRAKTKETEKKNI